MWYGMVCFLVVVVVTCSLQWMIELATRPSHLRVMSLWEIQGCHLPLHDLRRHVSLMSEACYVRIQMSPETTDELENTLPESGTYRMGSSAGQPSVVWPLLWPIKHASGAQLSSRKELAYQRRNCDGKKTWMLLAVLASGLQEKNKVRMRERWWFANYHSWWDAKAERGKVRSLLNNSFWDPKPYNPLAQSFREE